MSSNDGPNGGNSDDHRHDKMVTINVDGVDQTVARKAWRVSDLKAELKIDPAKVLAQITAHGLKDLADDDTIELHDKERFMTHARSGGSS